jgi:hypothetical protein
MVNYLLIKSFMKGYNHKKNKIKIFSFRSHSFFYFYNLFLKFYTTYMNAIHIFFQSFRFNIFLQLFVMDCMDSIFILIQNIYKNYLVLFSDHYFRISTVQRSLCYSSNILELPTYIMYQKVNLYIFLTYFCSNITQFMCTNIVSLPINNKLFTVLRSPHTDKKSREQFKLSIYNKYFIDKIGALSLFSKFFFYLSLFIRYSTYTLCAK